jgi:hypothetical protein
MPGAVTARDMGFVARLDADALIARGASEGPAGVSLTV